eukprot:11612750-Karenia_brevis.AAC.1
MKQWHKEKTCDQVQSTFIEAEGMLNQSELVEVEEMPEHGNFGKAEEMPEQVGYVEVKTSTESRAAI